MLAFRFVLARASLLAALLLLPAGAQPAHAAPLGQAPPDFTLTAAAVGNTSASLRWTPRGDASAYNVYAGQLVIAPPLPTDEQVDPPAPARGNARTAHPLARAQPGTWVPVAQGVHDTATTVADLPAEGTYAFLVRAVGPDGHEVAQSNAVDVSLAEAPGDELKLDAPAPGSVRLTWAPVVGAARYALLVGAPGRPLEPDPARQALTQTAAAIGGLPIGSTWRFAVVAQDGGGNMLARTSVAEITMPPPVVFSETLGIPPFDPLAGPAAMPPPAPACAPWAIGAPC
jgi:hypothetical protein